MAMKRRAMAARRGKAMAARKRAGAGRAAGARAAAGAPKVGIVVGIPGPKQVMKSLRKKKKAKQARTKAAMDKAGY